MSSGWQPLADPVHHRVALYGHDTLGLGHLRRNLALANAYAEGADPSAGADVLVITGSAEVGLFPRPRGVDALVLPGVRKDADGSYEARRLRAPVDSVVDLRRATLTTALTTFAPDVLIVDKTPWGFAGELSDVLVQLRRHGTKLVLGLRDVLDDPAAAAEQWTEDEADLAVALLYDEVWVYGDETVHDLVAECDMPEHVAAKVRHVGYLARGRPLEDAGHRPLGGTPYVLVTAGGGEDGRALALAAVRMGTVGAAETVVLTGPHMAAADIADVRSEARHHRGVHVMRFSRHSATWIAGAEAVVSMGGANTVAEILATDTPALIVPRIAQRREQLIRAEELHRWGAVAMLHPDALTPAAVATWVRANLGGSVDRSGLQRDGIEETVRRVRSLIGVTEPDTGAITRQRVRRPRSWPTLASFRGDAGVSA